jgi:TonB-dependent starch-binding outer membrane protein SusC
MKVKLYLRSFVMLMFGVALTSQFAFAQGRKVSGRVTDAGDNSGVPGASVVIKGTTKGVATDGDGNYSIDVRGGSDVLVISFVGYKSKEVTVGNQSAINVSLETDAAALDEVIVTGYSITNKKESTVAASIVKAKDLAQIPSGNVEQQLQGRVAGLTVITTGAPGTSSIIRVRGFGAFEGNQPLYVVDGVPTQNIDFLSPDDIESTTVLKDAAAASIYGSRAAAGVIVMTTKKGTKGKKGLQVSYDGLYGATDPNVNGVPKMLTPQEQAEWTHVAYRNNATANGTAPAYTHPQYGNSATASLPDYLHANGQNGVRGTIDRAAIDAAKAASPLTTFLIRPNLAGTNWYDEITRTGQLSRHSLGFSGGTDKSRFYVSLAAQNQQGILKYNDFARYSSRVNSEYDLGKKVRIGQNFQVTYRSVNGAIGNAGGIGVADDESVILSAYRMPSVIPVYDEYGQFASTRAAGFNNPRNPLREREYNAKGDRSFFLGGMGNVYIEIDPIKNLTLRSSIGSNFGNGYSVNYDNRYLGDSEPQASDSFSENASYFMNWVLTNTLNYKLKLGAKNNVNIFVGQEALNTGKGRNIGGSGINPFSMDPNFVTLNAVQSPAVNSSLFRGANYYSLFSKVDYNFNEKYYFTGVVRRDASSVFGANSRVGIFPAVSGAWRIASEDFMKDLPFISDLKLRAGWGLMGNSNNVDPANQFSLFGAGRGSSFYPIGGQSSGADEGYFRTRIGNADTKWETSETINLGFDATLGNGKWEVAFDLWRKTTRDLLFPAPIPAVAGPGASAPRVNIGSMRNQGIDFQIINRGKITNELKYDLTLNNSFLQNEIISLVGTQQFINGPGYRGISPIRNSVGQSLSSFFGYDVLGYFSSAEDVKNSPAQSGAGVGRFKYRDVNGDGVITPDDRTFLGSPVSPYSGGLNLGLTYKNWDFAVYTAFNVGNEIFNMSKWFTDFHGTFEGSGKGERAKESWTAALGDNAKAPIWESASNISTSGAENSWYVEDGSYLRMQNISVGYTFPTSMIKKMGINRARISGSVNNIFTITGYSGLDPAVGGDADSRFGVDVGNYPVTRSFNFGLNLGF